MGNNRFKRRRLVTSEVDTWSLGCVLSEATVWLTRDLTGLQEYGALRQEHSEEHGIEDSDCFHNPEKTLRCVEEYFQKMGEDLRRCGKMTESIVNMMRGDMLVAQQHRTSANTLWAKSHKMLQDAASMKYDNQANSEHLEIFYRNLGSPVSTYPVVPMPERRAATTLPRQQRASNSRNRKTAPLRIETDLHQMASKLVQHRYTRSPELIPAGRPAQVSAFSNEASYESSRSLGRLSEDAYSARSAPHPSPVGRSHFRTGSGGKSRPYLVTEPAQTNSQRQKLSPEAYANHTANGSTLHPHTARRQRRQASLPFYRSTRQVGGGKTRKRRAGKAVLSP